jgi:hypothetical protein
VRTELFAVVVSVTVLVAVPLAWEMTWRPGRVGFRLVASGAMVALGALAGTAELVVNAAPRWIWLCLLVAGELVATVLVGCGLALRRRARRRERDPGYAVDRLVSAPVARWVRPHPPGARAAHGVVARVDEWLAMDGPKPSAGWWHNGGLLLDARGAGLVDAAGFRHALPARAALLIDLPAPRALLLTDVHRTVLARLPTTGFHGAELRAFAQAVGWEYRDTADYGRYARDLADLRGAVIDHAARPHRSIRHFIRH